MNWIIGHLYPWCVDGFVNILASAVDEGLVFVLRNLACHSLARFLHYRMVKVLKDWCQE